MVQLSILLVARGEVTLNSVISSISQQSYADYELIVADSSGQDLARALGPVSGQVKTIDIPPATGLLRARSIAAKQASGKFSLLLDSTRKVLPGCFQELESLAELYDMVVVREESIGSTYWANLARLDKKITSSSFLLSLSLDQVSGVVLPRFFRTQLLQTAYADLEATIPRAVFDTVVFNDHQLVFGAARRHSSSLGQSEKSLLAHYEDESLGEVLRKYYRYGKSQRNAMLLPEHRYAGNLIARIRLPRGVGALNYMRVQPLYVARGLGFLTGYFSRDNRP